MSLPLRGKSSVGLPFKTDEQVSTVWCDIFFATEFVQRSYVLASFPSKVATQKAEKTTMQISKSELIRITQSPSCLILSLSRSPQSCDIKLLHSQHSLHGPLLSLPVSTFHNLLQNFRTNLPAFLDLEVSILLQGISKISLLLKLEERREEGKRTSLRIYRIPIHNAASSHLLPQQASPSNNQSPPDPHT